MKKYFIIIGLFIIAAYYGWGLYNESANSKIQQAYVKAATIVCSKLIDDGYLQAEDLTSCTKNKKILSDAVVELTNALSERITPNINAIVVDINKNTLLNILPAQTISFSDALIRGHSYSIETSDIGLFSLENIFIEFNDNWSVDGTTRENGTNANLSDRFNAEEGIHLNLRPRISKIIEDTVLYDQSPFFVNLFTDCAYSIECSATAFYSIDYSDSFEKIHLEHLVFNTISEADIQKTLMQTLTFKSIEDMNNISNPQFIEYNGDLAVLNRILTALNIR